MAPINSLERYLAIETAGGPSWHPDGKQIAFASNMTGHYQVYACAVTKGKVQPYKQLTNEKDRCTNPHYLSDNTLIFTRDHGGNENFQFGLIDEDKNLHWLTSNLKSKHSLSLITESYVYFTANLLDRSRLDVYRWRVPLKGHQPELVFKPERGMIDVSGASSNEDKILMTQYIGNMEQIILLLDIDSGKAENLIRAVSGNQPTRWEVIRWLDSDHILTNTDHESDMKRLGILNLSGEFRPFAELKDSVTFEVESEYAFSTDSIWTYFVENQEGYSTVHRAKFSKGIISEVETLPFPLRGVIPSGDARSWNHGLSLSVDEHQLAVTLSSGIQPTSVWIVDIKDMSIWRAHESNIAGLDPSTFVEPTLHRFKSFDGLSVPYFRYIPDGVQPMQGWPAIVMIHGGPESQIRPDFNPVIQFYISAGYAIVTPNIRGSDGYGRKYLNLDNLEKRLDSIMDVRHLVLHIKDEDKEIDGNRIVAYGGSYGGFAVLSAMTEHPDLWKAGIDIVGISDFVTFLQNTAPWRRSLREAEYGSLEHHIEILRRISPIRRIDRIRAPLFIIQGDNDERVPLSESIQMYEKLRDRGLSVRLLRFADEGHGLAKLENQIKAHTEVLRWLSQIV